MMNAQEGGCLCGAVRFRLLGPPFEIDYCHCHSCRKHTGAPVSAFADCKRHLVEFTKGAPKLFGFPASRSKVKHGKRTLCSTPQAYFTSYIDYNLYDRLRMLPFEHIVLTYHPNDLIGLDGIKQISPPLQGMSGSPIFICGVHKDVSTIEGVAVVGIFIEQPRRSNALIGIDIFTAVRMIKSFF